MEHNTDNKTIYLGIYGVGIIYFMDFVHFIVLEDNKKEIIKAKN
jgi:hypothetical protein